MADPVVLNYQNSLLRESDIELLTSPNWLNDTVIAFWFEYLEHDVYKDFEDKVAFVCPQVVQYLKYGHHDDIQSTLAGLKLNRKQYVFFPVNDCEVKTAPGGTHWSLLVYNAPNQNFEHYDSLQGSCNLSVARNLTQVLAPFLLSSRTSHASQCQVQKMECTLQGNSNDCGMHVICNTDGLCRKYLCGDRRTLTEIVPLKVVQCSRESLKRLIFSLKQ